MNPMSYDSKIDALSPEAQQRLAVILEDYLEHLDRGLSPNVEDLVGPYPELVEPLRAYLDSLNFLHSATAELRSDGQDCPIAAEVSWKQLGDYQIVREIGRGGMGVVYEAKQISLGRRVALKMLPFAAVLDRRQIIRFYNEAQAAAHLQHPNIVPVFFVGCDRGVHYYAMQYVEGQPLDVAIQQLRKMADASPTQIAAGDTTDPNKLPDANGLHSSIWEQFTTSASLQRGDYFRTVAKLGAEVAEALDYAHQCGVIHRDIKPSNLLLDEQGKVWITDFGLARFQANDRLTATGDVMGTTRYMSPEQVSGRSGVLNERTDVYSLGITLYEMATLTEAFQGANRHECFHRILEEEPRPPRHINPAIPGDLETILLKAIAKSPQERYPTAKELAEDLKHFLDGEPVLARRAGWADRAAKWARRHKSLVGAAAAMLLVVLMGSIISSLLIAGEHAKTKEALAQAEANYRQAEKNLHRAENHFRQLREVVDRFGAYHAEQLKGLPGAEPLRHELLLDTLGYYRGFIQYAGDDPTLQTDLAITHSKAAAVTEQLGDKTAALAEYRRAVEAFQAVVDSHPEEPQYRADLALCYNNLGLLLNTTGKPTEAENAYAHALTIQKQLVADHPTAGKYQSDLALTYGNLGMLCNAMDQPSKAWQAYEEAIQIQEQLVQRFPDKPDYHHNLAASYNNLSFLQAKTDPVKAETTSDKARSIQEKLVKTHPTVNRYQSDLALSYNNLGALKNHNGRLDQAEASYRQAIAIQEQLVRKSPSVIHFRCDLAVSHNNLGRLYIKSSQLDQAEYAFDRAKTIMEKLVADYPNEVGYRSTLGGIFNNLGRTLESLGRLDDAAKSYEQSIEHQRFACERAPQVAQFKEFLGKHYANYRRVLKATELQEKMQSQPSPLQN